MLHLFSSFDANESSGISVVLQTLSRTTKSDESPTRPTKYRWYRYRSLKVNRSIVLSLVVSGCTLEREVFWHCWTAWLLWRWKVNIFSLWTHLDCVDIGCYALWPSWKIRPLSNATSWPMIEIHFQRDFSWIFTPLIDHLTSKSFL